MALLSEALVQRSEDRVSESWQTVQDKATMSIKSPNRERIRAQMSFLNRTRVSWRFCLPGICPRGSSAYYTDSTPHLT